MENNGNIAGARSAKIRNIARGIKWLVPFGALAAIAVSLLQLNATPQGWLTESACKAAAEVGRFTPDPVACIALASVLLLYWTAKERKDAVILLSVLAGWLTGVPGVAIAGRWAVKGATYMFATIKRKVYEQIRAEGRAEARQQADAEWYAWLRRRTATGAFVPDDNDPPPYRSAE